MTLILYFKKKFYTCRHFLDTQILSVGLGISHTAQSIQCWYSYCASQSTLGNLAYGYDEMANQFMVKFCPSLKLF